MVDSLYCTGLSTCRRGLAVISISEHILHALMRTAQRTSALICSSRWPAQAETFSKFSYMPNRVSPAQQPTYLLRLVPDGTFWSGTKLAVVLASFCLFAAETVPIKHPVAASKDSWLSL